MNVDQTTQDSYIVLDDTQEKVKRVVAIVNKMVTSTMGPNGRVVAIANGVGHTVTKDGVTVARSIRFSNPADEMVGRIMTEAAIKTDDDCGDGTTTTTLLTAVLYEILSKHQTFREQAFVEKLVWGIIRHLQETAITVTTDSPELYRLALTSSNNDERLSSLITDIYKSSGDSFPEIEFKEANSSEDVVQRTSGLVVRMEYSNPGYSPNGQGEKFILSRPFIPLVIDSLVRGIDGAVFFPILKKLQDRLIEEGVESGTPLVIIARGVDNSVNSSFLAVNQNKAMDYPIVVMQTNFGGSVGSSLMGDIGAMLDAPVIPVFDDIVSAKLRVCTETLELGSARSLLVAPSEAAKERLKERVKGIETQLSEQEMSARHSSLSRFNESRVRALTGQLVTVMVGGETHSEIKERKDRFVDVTKAVRSALVNGILPGVGIGFFNATVRAVEEMTHDLEKGNEEYTWKVAIISKIMAMGLASTAKLMGTEAVKDAFVDPEKFLESVKVTNLATGEVGRPEALGIFDTAYASITALKGGLQTAKTLANLSGILLGDKLSAVKIQG